MVLVLSTLAAPVLGIDPLDDDAGTGGDAGDVRELAVPIEPGSYSGRLAKPHDLWDYYVFEGAAGKLARIAFNGDPDTHLGIEIDGGGSLGSAEPGETLEVLLPYDGTYFLGVTTPFVVLAPSIGYLHYRFEWSFRQPTAETHRMLSGSALAAEVAWDRPSAGTIVGLIQVPLDPDKPTFVMVVLEEQTLTDSWWEVHAVGWGPASQFAGGLGHEVVVSPSPLPHLSLPVPAVRVGTGWFSLSANFTNLVWARLTLHAGTEGRIIFTATSNALFDSRTVDAVPSFIWDERNAGADVQILAPGVSATGSRSLLRNLTGRSVVFMDTGGWQGSITDPAGDRRELGAANPSDFVVFPSPGAWTFALGPTVGAGFSTVHRYLHEVEVPSLGLLPGRAHG